MSDHAGFQHSDGVLPDLVTSAKGISGAYLPLAVVGMRRYLHDHFRQEPLGWGSTYHAHPVALACAYEAIKHRQHGRRGRLVVGPWAGHHQLLRLHLKAWGRPSHHFRCTSDRTGTSYRTTW